MEQRRDSSGDTEEDELQCVCSLCGSNPSSHPSSPIGPLSTFTVARISRSRRKKESGGRAGGVGGGEPLTDKTEGPVTNPNPQSLTGQSLLSAAPIPDRGHIEDVKQQTSTCLPRYQPAQRGSHCTGRQLRPQQLTASPRQGGGHTSAPYHAAAARTLGAAD